MFSSYRKLSGLLTRQERVRAAAVIGFMFIVGVFEVVSIASIMPFVAVLSRPEIIETNPWLAGLYESFGFTSTRAFIIFLGLVFLLTISVSILVRMMGHYAMSRFAHNRNYRWGVRLLERYVAQPYEWFLDRHSSGFATAILTEIHRVVVHALRPAMEIIAYSMILILLIFFLLWVDPVLTVGAVILIGGGYAAVGWLAKKPATRLGAERLELNRVRYRLVQEMFGGAKELKVMGLGEPYVRRFAKPAAAHARCEILISLWHAIPAHAMQGLFVSGMLLALMYLVATRGDFSAVMPVASVFALAAYRMMPSFQKLYKAFVDLASAAAPLDAIVEDMDALKGSEDEGRRLVRRLELKQGFSLDGVTYSYPNTEHPALKELTIDVSSLTTIGLVGPTGSGKTTVVDIMLGLLRPQEGRMLVDCAELTDELVPAWQRSIGYVPQHIFLTDESIAANIALGVGEARVDRDAVERAARAASLHEFIVTLPDGYDTVIGERGVRLSGGQRQRIGIARALYRDPEVLILDEATSALDSLTERDVMEAIRNMGHQKTIVLIAHRLSTVEHCDKIYVLEQGEVVGVGSYEELLSGNAQFQALAAVSN